MLLIVVPMDDSSVNASEHSWKRICRTMYTSAGVWDFLRPEA